jgi:hypothetical protein
MTDYELTRRDALAALAAAGVATTASALTWESLGDAPTTDEPEFTDHDRELLDAIAAVVYPSAVSGIPAFVETYVVGRVREDPDRMTGITEGVRYVDAYASEWYDKPYLDLATDRQETVLSAMGAEVTEPDPDGSDIERLRFYVVNELLYALYTSPTGGELLGLENPQGYPGGTESYQRGPPE